MIENPRRTALKALPSNQRARINVCRCLGLLLIPPALFIRPYFAGAFGGFLEQAGVMLVIACVLGRCWAMLYIGGNKNGRLTTTGPYSLCRNPLYVFSVLGVAGCGLMIQSLTYAVLLTSVALAILFQAARSEEGYLAEKFGEDYAAYRRRTPRFVPVNFRAFQTASSLRVNVSSLKRCFWDATLFILTIPALELVEWLHEIDAVATFVLP
ncbi:MAG: isoprenylcysteine carboxylmethyltransferase family protein [Candidatus Tectomicrobia bacterium]|nr:isoprenylcysteine carboxylmethyltransferase family protein [Candidatus Tectomicrobia bacterium]